MIAGQVSKSDDNLDAEIDEGSIEEGASSLVEELSLSLSTSSGGFSSQSGNSFDKMIKDFKKALGERKTPGNLVFLNRIILVITLLSIVLSCVEYSIKRQLVVDLTLQNDYALKSE